MDLYLNKKNVVVIGASRGIGKAIALMFAAEGANVAICARKEAPLLAAEAELKTKGVNIYAATCDVKNGEALESFLDSVKQQLGSVDVLVNNVSGFAMGDTFADWEKSLTVDILASVRATQKVIPWMIEAGGGSILFTSSIAGLEGGPVPAYGAAKAAIISYSKSLAVSLATKGIRSNVIAPGAIEFEGGSWARLKEQNPPMYKYVQSTIPAGRMGTAEEVANVAVFLASSRASWVTGSCVSVDGSQHKGNL